MEIGMGRGGRRGGARGVVHVTAPRSECSFCRLADWADRELERTDHPSGCAGVLAARQAAGAAAGGAARGEAVCVEQGCR